MLYAETLFLVDDYQPEILELHLARKERVGADHYVRRSVEEPRPGTLLLFFGLEAAHRLDADGGAFETRKKRFVVLLRKNRCRGEKHRLLPVHGCDERCAHGDLRLAVACVSAYEAVHWL